MSLVRISLTDRTYESFMMTSRVNTYEIKDLTFMEITFGTFQVSYFDLLEE